MAHAAPPFYNRDGCAYTGTTLDFSRRILERSGAEGSWIHHAATCAQPSTRHPLDTNGHVAAFIDQPFVFGDAHLAVGADGYTPDSSGRRNTSSLV